LTPAFERPETRITKDLAPSKSSLQPVRQSYRDRRQRPAAWNTTVILVHGTVHDELEQMTNEEERQRTHEQWRKAVEKSTAAFSKKRKALAQRQQLINSLRLVGKKRWLRVGFCSVAD
ncbi:hypothetical protein JG688_00016706, partial [Phytophthora aleatoria]